MLAIRIVFFLIFFFVSFGCRKLVAPPSPADGAKLQATSILGEQGSWDRCNDVYPDMYEKSKNIFKTMIHRYNLTFGELSVDSTFPRMYLFLDFSGGKNKAVKDKMNSSPVKHDLARKVLVNTYQMFLNMTRSKDRPIHPVAFFAVVKDFEVSVRKKTWSSGTKFLFTTDKCVGLCYGYFQVSLDSYKRDGIWNAENICGASGLGIINTEVIEGGLDFCASQFWWTKNGARKCGQMNYGGPNPCIDRSYAWTPSTFAYAWRDAYIQANQWAEYGIDDSWAKMYTGLVYNRIKHLGYEHCAVQHYLKQYFPQLPKNAIFVEDFDPKPYVPAAVRHFLYEIGITPHWSNEAWHPGLFRPTIDAPASVKMRVRKDIQQKEGETIQEYDLRTVPGIPGVDSPHEQLSPPFLPLPSGSSPG